MDARGITVALRGKWQGRYGLCRCPSHADRTPSLKISDDPNKADGIDLHCFAGCDWRDVKTALIHEGLLPEFAPGEDRPVHRDLAFLIGRTLRHEVPALPLPDDAHKQKIAAKIWQHATPLFNTLGYRYFTEHRSLRIEPLGDLSHCLRWHEGVDAVIALMTDPIANQPCGIHRTFLNADGTKRERKMLGRQGVVRLSPDEHVHEGLGLCEGVEDALAILLTGWAPVWAATSAGAIERFPVLAGIDGLTVFMDEDAAGSKAAEACAERWALAGREVLIAHPKGLSDG